jgi:RNA polymerase sigma-70 factor (ECF subfamily)
MAAIGRPGLHEPDPTVYHENVDQDQLDIQATLDGDGEAFRAIMERHQDAVARRMWKFTRDRRELEELTQTIFVEAYRSLAGFRGEAPLRHWLMRIATRVGYRYWKRRKKRNDVLPLQDWDRPVDGEVGREMQAREAAQRVHRLLEQLPPRDRLVLTLMYLEDMSVAQIAEEIQWSQTMVKVQAHRARKKLRALMEHSRHDAETHM